VDFSFSSLPVAAICNESVHPRATASSSAFIVAGKRNASWDRLLIPENVLLSFFAAFS
jgi:hypothetical protein